MVMRRLGICRRRRQRDGQSTVEFALVFPFFILCILGVVDFSRYMFFDQSLAHTVRSGLRVAVTGRVLENPEFDEKNDPPEDEFLSRRETIIRAIELNNVANVEIKANGNANDTLILQPSDGGGPGDLVTVTMTYDFSFITPLLNFIVDPTDGGNFVIRQEATYRNEQFDD